MKKIEELARTLLTLVGDTENVTSVTHCMTRLRFHLKDWGLVQMDEIKKVQGVMGVQNSAGELQIIIGPTVPSVCAAVCKLGNFEQLEAIDENLDGVEKEKLSVKTVFRQFFDGMSGCVAPLIPAFVVMGLLNLIVAVLGPSMLAVIAEDSDLYQIIYIASQSILYFLPMLIAYSASKKFNANTIVSIILAGILLHPSLIEIINTSESFTVYGIPMPLMIYSSSVLPMVLTVWVQSYLEKLLNRFVPASLNLMLVPLSTVLVMLPLMLCLLAPLGQYFGLLLADLLGSLYEVAGPLETTLVGAFHLVLLSLGMTKPVFAIVLANFFQTGIDYMYMPMAMTTLFSIMGICIGFIIKARDNNERQLGVSCLVAQVLGGVSEPAIFGIMFNFKKVMLAQIIGGAAGGLYVGIMHVGFTTFASSNILSVLSFAGSTNSNFINGIIACVISFIVSFAVVLLLGIESNNDKKIEA